MKIKNLKCMHALKFKILPWDDPYLQSQLNVSRRFKLHCFQLIHEDGLASLGLGFDLLG